MYIWMHVLRMNFFLNYLKKKIIIDMLHKAAHDGLLKSMEVKIKNKYNNRPMMSWERPSDASYLDYD